MTQTILESLQALEASLCDLEGLLDDQQGLLEHARERVELHNDKAEQALLDCLLHNPAADEWVSGLVCGGAGTGDLDAERQAGGMEAQ